MKKCINANTTQVVNEVDKGSLPDGLGSQRHRQG